LDGRSDGFLPIGSFSSKLPVRLSLQMNPDALPDNLLFISNQNFEYFQNVFLFCSVCGLR